MYIYMYLIHYKLCITTTNRTALRSVRLLSLVYLHRLCVSRGVGYKEAGGVRKNEDVHVKLRS